jgi:hypothetical protein
MRGVSTGACAEAGAGGTTQTCGAPSMTSLVRGGDPTQRRWRAVDLAATAHASCQRKAINLGGAVLRSRAWAEDGRVFKQARVRGSPAAEPSDVAVKTHILKAQQD